LLVAIPDAFEGGQTVEQARRINPALNRAERSVTAPAFRTGFTYECDRDGPPRVDPADKH
jgi:hypothetical protein